MIHFLSHEKECVLFPCSVSQGLAKNLWKKQKEAVCKMGMHGRKKELENLILALRKKRVGSTQNMSMKEKRTLPYFFFSIFKHFLIWYSVIDQLSMYPLSACWINVLLPAWLVPRHREMRSLNLRIPAGENMKHFIIERHVNIRGVVPRL